MWTLLGVELGLPKLDVEVLAPGASISKLGLWRYNQVKMRSFWIRVGIHAMMCIFSRHWSKAPLSQGTTTRSWKKQQSILSWKLQREREQGPAHTDISDFQPPELRGNKFLLFKLLDLCSSVLRKPTCGSSQLSCNVPTQGPSPFFLIGPL